MLQTQQGGWEEERALLVAKFNEVKLAWAESTQALERELAEERQFAADERAALSAELKSALVENLTLRQELERWRAGKLPAQPPTSAASPAPPPASPLTREQIIREIPDLASDASIGFALDWVTTGGVACGLASAVQLVKTFSVVVRERDAEAKAAAQLEARNGELALDLERARSQQAWEEERAALVEAKESLAVEVVGLVQRHTREVAALETDLTLLRARIDEIESARGAAREHTDALLDINAELERELNRTMQIHSPPPKENARPRSASPSSIPIKLQPIRGDLRAQVDILRAEVTRLSQAKWEAERELNTVRTSLQASLREWVEKAQGYKSSLAELHRSHGKEKKALLDEWEARASTMAATIKTLKNLFEKRSS